MVAPIHPLAIFSGSAHPTLAHEVARLLGLSLGQTLTTRLPDSEIHVKVEEVVRDKDIFFIQPGCEPVNDNLMEILLYLDAFRRASAHSVSVVIPYFPYARQERMARGREAISARVVADAIERGGARRVIYVDIHNQAIQGFFRIPADPLSAIPVLADYFRKPEFSNAAIVSPDIGRAGMASKYADLLNLPLVIMQKRRVDFATTKVTHIVGTIAGKRPIMVDDVIAGGSVLKELDVLYREGAAGNAYLAITHPVLLPSAMRLLSEDDRIEKLVVSNSIPLGEHKRHPKLEVLSIAPLIAEIVKRIYRGESISDRLVLA